MNRRSVLPHQSTNAGIIDLKHALRAGWVKFWYQPKIDLRRKQIVGVEMFARADHPYDGVLSAATFVPGADDKSLAQLSVLAIDCALQVSQTLLKSGTHVPVTVNVPIDALNNLPTELILDPHPQGREWPGLVFDTGEDDVMSDLPGLSRIVDDLAACGLKLAADGFGRNLCSLIQSTNSTAMQEQVEQVSKRLLRLKTVSVYELKLDRGLVSDCASDPQRLALCKMVIDLIHHIGSTAVAVGLERVADVAALRDLGCEVGQGNYFSRPLPIDEFLAMLKSRSIKHR